MKGIVRLTLIVAALLLLAGCSGYRLAYLPGDMRDSSEVGSDTAVEVGKRVRLTLLTGEIVEGIVSEVTAGYLELATSSPDVALATYDAGQLSKLEVYVEKPASAELGAAAFVVGGLVGGYYLIHSDDVGQMETHTAK